MSRLIPFLKFLGVAAALCICGMPARAQVYSYLDDNGVRIITNVPPTGPVHDMRVSGVPRVVPADSTAASKGPAGGDKGLDSANPLGVVKESSGKRPTASQVLPPGRSNQVDYETIVQKYAAEYRLDPDLIWSMISTESGFNQRAVSPKGAQGLMQLMPQTAMSLGVRDPFDPEQNIWGGTKYMSYLLDSFAEDRDSLLLSLAAYNAGENLVRRMGRIPDIRETNEYVRSVIQHYGKSKMAPPPPVLPSVPQMPQLFDFIDEHGVRNLTNIPPVPKPSSESSLRRVPVIR